jgi:hypothetical protein
MMCFELGVIDEYFNNSDWFRSWFF